MKSLTKRASKLTAAMIAATSALLCTSCGSGPTRTAEPSTSTVTPSSSGLATSLVTSASMAAPAIPAALLGKDIAVIPTTKKIAALTFDAGGNADGLSAIMTALSGQRVPATFFVTGSWAAKYPASVKALASGGYRLGNHTATHPHLTTLSDVAITAELTKARTQIMNAGGTDPKPLFRFPFGDRNAHTISVVNNAGYVPIRWTVDTLGWKGTSGGASKQLVIDRAVNAARPGEIVLMHVGSNPDDHTTLDAAALPTVIAKLKTLGYGFVTLDALFTASGGGGVILPGCDSLSWKTTPLSVSHNPTVPPVPVVTGIRPGAHPECKYDRIVFDISGSTPGYEVRYVSSVTADPSNNPVSVPGNGSKFLLITLHPAQGHSDAGASTVPKSAALGYPTLKGYAVAGDFEGHISIALGLSKIAQVRVGELPGRIYVDMAY
jgi:peptidoglycan-N-acetylglucosamine deacetylase